MELRSVAPDELNFVISTWSRSFKRSRAAGLIADEDWAAVMHPQFRKLLCRPGARTLVLADGSALDGWACGERQDDTHVLHFVYVKENYRGSGRANRLLDGLGIPRKKFFIYTTWTPIVLEFAARDPNPYPRAKHDPNFARYANYRP